MVSETPEPVTTANVHDRRLWLGLKYWDGKPVLKSANVVSKSSRIMTVTVPQLQRLARGFPAKLDGGVVEGLNLGECMFVSTSQGVLEAREAIAKKVGGVLMCRVS